MAKQKEPITLSRAFLEGLARIFDPFSSTYCERKRKTVSEQLQEDWETIGRDMKAVFPSFEERVKEDQVQ